MIHDLPDPADFPLAGRAATPKATAALGACAARLLRGGETILLWGPLGAGKTLFVQGLCDGLDVGDEVVSPTFTLANRYVGRLVVHHLDCYRLEADDDLHDVGLEGILEEVEDGGAVLLVEWPGPVLGWTPRRLELLVTPDPDERARTWRLRGVPDLPDAWSALFDGEAAR